MNLHSPSVTWDALRRESYVFDTKDYKVLRTVSYDGKQTLTLSKVEVWSLARGTWNTLTSDNIPADYLPINYQKGKAFVDGIGFKFVGGMGRRIIVSSHGLILTVTYLAR